ncbi:S-ureidoglycine aminohydrolase [Raoultella planticola]|nr:S-ureidoglycine aminohydrolase [Raoultella planticola]
MGYLNNVVGYRDDLLASRSIVRHGNYALLTPDGLVKNVIPGFEHCDVTILSTPKLGATFVDYLVTLHENGGNQSGFGGEGIETFLYVIMGKSPPGLGKPSR